MIAVVLGLSSCSKESMLLGSWKLETIQMGNMTLDTGDTESDAVITFKDGEILEFTSAGLTESCPYTINDNKIIVNDEEFEFEFYYSPDTMFSDRELQADVYSGVATCVEEGEGYAYHFDYTGGVQPGYYIITVNLKGANNRTIISVCQVE
jgi:hypothetical protein